MTGRGAPRTPAVGRSREPGRGSVPADQDATRAAPDPRRPSVAAYDRASEATVTLRGQTVRVVTKPGLAGGGRLAEAELALAEAVSPVPTARVLVLGGGPGALAVALARQVPDGMLWVADTSHVALAMAERTLAANGVGNARIWPDPLVAPSPPGGCDLVVLVAPPDRQLARRWLVAAHDALGAGGRLYLAGANDAGIRSVIADAKALFGGAVSLASRRRQRVATAERAAGQPAGADRPAWADHPGIAPGTWHEFDLEVRGMAFHLRSLPGVFAHGRLDGGTALLLAALDALRGARVADVGCGSGIIGLVAARLGAARVDLVDANLLAVAAAGANIAANGVAGARALPSDLLSAVAGERYDLIVSNPPFHLGKEVDLEVARALVGQAREALVAGGRLLLVANAFLRYDRPLRERFDAVECLADNGRYRVLAATVRPAHGGRPGPESGT